MSLMNTLAKVAIGVAVAKGANAMLNRNQGGGQPSRGGGGLLGQLGGALGGQQQGGMQSSGTGGGLGGMLGQVLSGRQQPPGGMGGAFGQRSGGASGGLGGMLEQLGGAMGGQSGQGGGLGGALGGLLGGAAAGGGLGGMLGQLAGNAQRPRGEPEGSFGEVLNSSLDPERQELPATPEQEAAAGLMLRAMVMAAKADGEIDENEREKLLGNLQDADPQEQAFVREELQRPVDPEGLARDVPRGLEPQVYAMSVMAIDLDTREEAQYLHRLAEAMGLSRDQVNSVHDQLGVPSLYRS